MAHPPNIVAAFLHPLPGLARATPLGVLRTVQASPATEKIKPPFAWVPHALDYFVEGNRWLNRLQYLQAQQSQRANRWLKQGKHPPLEQTRLLQELATDSEPSRLYTEGDVNLASNTHLLNPVSVAMKGLYGSMKFQYRSEKTHGDTRSDIVWEFLWPGADPNDPSKWIEFAILEFKNTNVIHEEHFNKGKVEIAQRLVKASSVLDLLQGSRNRPQKTFLTANAIPLTKQAKKYSVRAKHVVLFDWDMMVLFDFREEDETQPTSRFLKLTLFRETEAEAARGGTYRKLLLAYLVDGLRYTASARGLDPDS